MRLITAFILLLLSVSNNAYSQLIECDDPDASEKVRVYCKRTLKGILDIAR